MSSSIGDGCPLVFCVCGCILLLMEAVKMTKNEFAAICGEYLIDPALALESENIRAAIRLGEEVLREALEEEF